MRRREHWTGPVLLICLAALLLPGARPALAGDGDAVAIVNGQPVTKRRMVEVLMESHGLQVLQQLIVLELAKEESARLKLDVRPQDVDREFDQALAKIAPEANSAGQTLTDEERRQVLEQLLQDKGLSVVEFRLGMERNAHLRKIVERDFRVDEATLREEFARVYGEKVEARSIQVETIDGLHEALNLLEKGTEFAEVARRVSQDSASVARGGLLEPFAFNDEAVAPVLREAVFALAPGERTKPIKVGRWWFVLQLERRVPPADTRFDDVRGQVEAKLRERVVPDRMNQLIVELFQKAEIRILDAKLRPKFEELLKQNAIAPPGTP